MRGYLRSFVNSGKSLVSRTAHGLFVLVALVMILPVALSSMPIAIVGTSALALTTTALIVGWGRTGSGLLVLGFGTVSLNDVRPIGALGFLELSDVFFMAGFLFLAPRLGRTNLRISAAFLLGGAGLLTVGVLSALAGNQPGDDFHYLLDLAIGVVLVPVLLVWWQPGRRNIIAAAAAYMLGNVVNVIASLAQSADGNGRHSGLTTHPNVMGLCALLSLSLAPFLLSSLPRRLAWTVGIGSAVSAYGIWISGSRAALLCAAVLALLYPLLKRSIPAVIAGAALCLPAVVLVDRESRNPSPSNALGRLLGGGGSGDSNRLRETGAQAGFDQFFSHPWLGGGWGTVFNAHNAYLQVAAAIGLFGLVFYVMMLIPMLRPLLVVPPPYGFLAVPVLAAVMISVVDPALGARYIWSVAALSLCADRVTARAKERTSKISEGAARDRRLAPVRARRVSP